uniref:RING-type domain-containing protein n=1 Tax=Ficedula albicollis TaxID=59894 RepID=A0A803V2E9_FICAL
AFPREIYLIEIQNGNGECTVCLESPTHPVITHCAHVFCKTCIFEVLRNEKVGCSMVKSNCNSYLKAMNCYHQKAI